ncbi:MAG: RnfABCDGE type electron transport complex subunit G [Bacteroidia bacterium]|nr:MAG: RnfABCDGE type electron transport complex subunit G [Bacteroidia bacterium]
MAKKESTFLNMVLTLIIVAAAASFTLATVYNLTKAPIERAREAARQEAIGMVLPDFDELQSKRLMPVTGSDSLEFNLAYRDGNLVGIAVATYTGMGYSGRIRAMVGFTPDGEIIDVVPLEHSETPGLGDKIEKGKSDWSNQFRGFDPRVQTLKVRPDGGDIDNITAATITARAYCDAIDRAFQTFKAHHSDIINKENE